MRTLRRLSRKGISVLLTSHDPQGAAAVADTIHLLKDGRLRVSGSPRAVLTASTLRAAYGVPFSVRWSRGRFTCAFESA
jgi:iron complex transport system ATP-binding protein